MGHITCFKTNMRRANIFHNTVVRFIIRKFTLAEVIKLLIQGCPKTWKKTLYGGKLGEQIFIHKQYNMASKCK